MKETEGMQVEDYQPTEKRYAANMAKAERAWRRKWPEHAKEALRVRIEALEYLAVLELNATTGASWTGGEAVQERLQADIEKMNERYSDNLSLVPEAREMYRRISQAVKEMKKVPEQEPGFLEIALRPVCLFALEECGYILANLADLADGGIEYVDTLEEDGLASDELVIDCGDEQPVTIFVAKGKALKAQREYEFLRRQGIGIKEASVTALEIVAKKNGKESAI